MAPPWRKSIRRKAKETSERKGLLGKRVAAVRDFKTDQPKMKKAWRKANFLGAS